MTEKAAPRTVHDWLALPVDARRARLDGVIERAGVSRRSHGTYIAVSEHAPAASAGPLASVPFAVKDNIDVAGFETTAGTPFLVGSSPERDANAVNELRAAGAVDIGKTNLHELAFGVTSDNAAFGPVRNPVDPALSAGGSSGGSAVTVALGDVPFSLGTDTGGSITVPASFSGVVGFRPTTGRYPGDGVVNLSFSRDTIGIHAHTVDDVITVDQALVRGRGPRPMPAIGGLRLGLLSSYLYDLDPTVHAVMTEVRARLTAAGARLVEIPGDGEIDAAATAGFELVFFEARRTLLGHVAALGAPFSALTLKRMTESAASEDVRQVLALIDRTGPGVTAYDEARAVRWRARRRHQQMFLETGVDALLFPSVPVLPPPVGENTTVELGGRHLPLFPTITRHAGPGSFAGFPMLSIPAARTGQVPIGITLEGAAADDDDLLAVGRSVERVLREDA